MSIYEILEQISSTSSRNEKEAILLAHKDNTVLQRVFQLAYDPFEVFYIKKIPTYTGIDNPFTLEQTLEDLSCLTSRQLTGNAAIEWLRNRLSSLSGQDASVIERIISKDLRIGITGNTANKIWPGLVRSFPCLLCEQPNDRYLAKIKYPAYFQMKLDGMRFNAVVDVNSVEYFSRNGKSIDLHGLLDQYFLGMTEGHSCVFDGELLMLDPASLLPLPRATGNGILQRAVKGKAAPIDLAGVSTVLWDVISIQAFRSSQPDLTPYKSRFELLNNLVSRVDNPRIKVVDTHVVNSLEEVQSLFQGYLEQGQEGGILKNIDSIWKDSRSSDLLKFKAELTADMLCTGWIEGTGKYTGKIGALSLETSDGLIKTNCGSGLKDEQREELKNSIVGKIIEVSYNAKIKDKKTGQQSLFLPIFKSVRNDKDLANSSKELK